MPPQTASTRHGLTMQKTYSTQPSHASVISLKQVTRRLAADPSRLWLEAQRLAHLTVTGELDTYDAWAACFLGVTMAGVPHLKAQQRIGEIFAAVRRKAELTA